MNGPASGATARACRHPRSDWQSLPESAVPMSPADTPTPPLLSLHNIQVVYGGAIEAVRDVSLDVPAPAASSRCWGPTARASRPC
jgi:hypothetical protein